LDTIDYISPKKREYYLGATKSDDILTTYCYINGTGLRFLLVFFGKREFDKKVDQLINSFFVEANKCLVNAILNPLYKQKEEIKSVYFEEKIINLGK
jgi:hypothetical protein